MKIFVDENIPSITVQTLGELGHDVMDIRGTINEGMPDDKLWELIQDKARIFITTDKGFSQYRNQTHYGILIVCLKKPNEDKIHQRIMQVFNQIDESEWNSLLVVVRDTVQSISRPNI